PDGRQVARFAPLAGWLPATNYTIALRAGAVPAGGNLPLLTPRRWSFTTAPQPTLTGRFPGEGQTLPPGQEIRLIFNTPVDGEAIRAAIQLTPTADILRVTGSETEVRIAADVRAATPYTITLPATLSDRNGIPLAQEYRLRFVTAPSGPALALPDVPAHLAQALPGQPAGLLIRRTNLSALNFNLYQLDESAVVRTSSFLEADWAQFLPERYGQPLLRSWSVPLADPLNQPVEDRVALATAKGDALPAGAYYLRIRTPEGPQANLLVLISRVRLTLQSSARPAGADALIWATDIVSGTPIGGLPVALYQSGTLIESQTTDASGLARFAQAAGAGGANLVALADGGRRGFVSSAWGDAGAISRERPRLFLTTDRAAYQPGERVELAGIVRAAGALSDALGLPNNAAINLSLRAAGAAGRIYQQELSIGDTGVFSASVALAASAPSGAYSATASFGGAAVLATFVVRPDSPAPLEASVGAPAAAVVAGTPAPLDVAVDTPEGLPVASATISWTLDAQRVPFPRNGEYNFGDPERAPIEVAPQTGMGQLDGTGRLSLVITDTLAGDTPLRYRLRVEANEPAGPSASAEGSFLVVPAPIYVGVRLPSRIFTAGKAGRLELLATTPEGRLAPSTSLLVEVYRRSWQRAEEPGPDGRPRAVWRPVDTLAFTRAADTGDDGTASLPLSLPSGGAYRIRVGTAADIKASYSATTIWATASGFSSWGELPSGQPLLIADRDTYRPGDTATLLLTARGPQAPVLITRSAADGLTGEARVVRSGESFTLTVRPEDTPALALAVLLPPPPLPDAAAARPLPLVLTSATLPVRDDRAELSVALATDRDSYAPGATA
ncbi:MAG TPA: MG2 domain-containing protein, partial [Roseiflexaceae bacterium]|nr:MG2 domain-containing protein [Roseiflexaceae bacterium]